MRTDAALRRPRLGHQLDVLQAGGLGDLVVYAGDLLPRARPGDVDAQVPDLAVEVGRVDVVLLVEAVDARAAARVLVRRQDAEAGSVNLAAATIVGRSFAWVS